MFANQHQTIVEPPFFACRDAPFFLRPFADRSKSVPRYPLRLITAHALPVQETRNHLGIDRVVRRTGFMVKDKSANERFEIFTIARDKHRKGSGRVFMNNEPQTPCIIQQEAAFKFVFIEGLTPPYDGFVSLRFRYTVTKRYRKLRETSLKFSEQIGVVLRQSFPVSNVSFDSQGKHRRRGEVAKREVIPAVLDYSGDGFRTAAQAGQYGPAGRPKVPRR